MEHRSNSWLAKGVLCWIWTCTSLPWTTTTTPTTSPYLCVNAWQIAATTTIRSAKDEYVPRNSPKTSRAALSKNQGVKATRFDGHHWANDNSYEESTRMIHSHSSLSKHQKNLIRRVTSLGLSASIAASAWLFGSTSLTSGFDMHPPPVAAEASRVVGQLQGSGFIFKDTLLVESFEDPKVQGVTLYISNFQIPLTERFSSKSFFSDPSYASVACARTAPTIRIATNIAKGPGGEEVFEESRSILLKTLRVQRIYDENTNTVVYVSFSTRFDKSDDTNKSRFKSSLCAINLNDNAFEGGSGIAVPVTTTAAASPAQASD